MWTTITTEESWKIFCRNYGVIETKKDDPKAFEHDGKYYKTTISGSDIGETNLSKSICNSENDEISFGVGHSISKKKRKQK